MCQLGNPVRYPKDKSRDAVLQNVKVDLPEILRGRHIDFVTRVDAEKKADGGVRVHARISNKMALPLDNWYTMLDTPQWIQDAKDFHLVVSGPSVDAESLIQRDFPRKIGDISAVTVECSVFDEDYSGLMVDFFVDNQRLKREKVMVAGI